jgi:NADH-quinone oxidoreductase subunit E
MKPVVLDKELQPESFEFTPENQEKIKEIIARYPKGKQKSAVMPLLDLAQRQMGEEGAKQDPPVGGWIPLAAIKKIAEILNLPEVRVHEVVTFYSMFKLTPMGKYNIQICGTTPCWLCGSDKIKQACEEHLGIKTGETTEDGYFTLEEVECLGACVNAPMIQVNADDYYEDLTPERMVEILDLLKEGKEEEIPVGSQKGRMASMAETGPTTLEEQAKKAKVK